MEFESGNIKWKSRLIFLAYPVLAVLLWQDNLSLPLEFHDREMFRDHVHIADTPAFFFSVDKEQFNGRWMTNVYQLLVFLLAGENSIALYRSMAILLHSLVTGLVVWLALQSSIKKHAAHAAGLLFYIAPSHYQVLHHISAVDYILCALFGLWALKRVQARPIWDWVLMLILLAAAFSHQSGIAFAALCWWRVYGSRWRAGWGAALFLVALTGVLLWTQPEHTSASHSLDLMLSDDVNYLSYVSFYFAQVGRMFVFAFGFPLVPNAQESWLILIGLCALLVLSFFAYRKEALRPWIIGWIVLSLPYMLMVELRAGLPGGTLRYLYVPSALAYIAVAALLLAPVRSSVCYALIFIGSTFAAPAWKVAADMTLYSAGRAAMSGGLDEEAFDLYRQVWDSEDLPEQYMEEMYAYSLMLMIGKKEDFRPVLKRSLERFPNFYTLQVIMWAETSLEDAQSLKNFMQNWRGNESARRVLASAYFNLSRHYRENGVQHKQYYALALAQYFNPQERTLRLLKSLGEDMDAQGVLDRNREQFISLYGPVLGF